MKRQVDYRHRLADRREISPELFTQVMHEKGEELKRERDFFEPKHSFSNVYNGT